ncbi:hypothetical protein TNCV_754081 [Trichonephila clavipes]|nr:hypothetical protein TNCV_754081 [Trichonephila clavipes]
MYHAGNVQTVVRMQIDLRTVINSLQDHQNGGTAEQVIRGQFGVRAVPTLQVRSCSIFVDFHPSQVTCPESVEGNSNANEVLLFSASAHPPSLPHLIEGKRERDNSRYSRRVAGCQVDLNFHSTSISLSALAVHFF